MTDRCITKGIYIVNHPDFFPELFPPPFQRDIVESYLLEPVLQKIEAQIGMDKTLLLVDAYGGTRLYVPKLRLADDHPLVVLLGTDAAAKLQKLFGGDVHFDLTRAKSVRRLRQNTEIRRLRNELSVRDLALKFNLNERTIRKICNQ
jgi:hypothetical protein